MVQILFRQLPFCERTLKNPGSQFFPSVSDTEATSHGQRITRLGLNFIHRERG